MLTNYIKRKSRSKKGMTLVETVCAIMVLAIVVVGVLNSVSFSREMVYTNNAREKASDKAQLVADEIQSAATGVDPGASGGDTIIEDKVNAIANEGVSGAVNDQNEEIGTVTRVSELNAFHDPVSPSGDDYIQYLITAITDEDETTTDTESIVGGYTRTSTVTTVMQPGWDITVRVYYKTVANDNNYKYVEVKAFSAKTYAPY